MKSFIIACVAMIGIAVVAYYGLNAAGFSTQDRTAGQSVRVE